MTSSTSGRSEWLSTTFANGGIKLKLDMVIGQTSEIESSDKNTLGEIAGRIRDLTNRLHDIRREQVFQRVCYYSLSFPFPPFISPFVVLCALFHMKTQLTRFFFPRNQEREAEFRDQSESTNSRVIRWMIIQLVVIGGTCAWQLSHLRSFFIKQKLT